MDAGIYEFFPNGRLMEIVNHHEGQVKFANTIIAIPLSDEEKNRVMALKKVGFSDKEIFAFRRGHIRKRSKQPLQNKEQRLFKIPLKDLRKRQLLEIIENGLKIKLNTLSKLTHKDLSKLAEKVIELTQLQIVLVY